LVSRPVHPLSGRSAMPAIRRPAHPCHCGLSVPRSTDLAMVQPSPTRCANCSPRTWPTTSSPTRAHQTCVRRQSWPFRVGSRWGPAFLIEGRPHRDERALVPRAARDYLAVGWFMSRETGVSGSGSGRSASRQRLKPRRVHKVVRALIASAKL